MAARTTTDPDAANSAVRCSPQGNGSPRIVQWNTYATVGAVVALAALVIIACLVYFVGMADSDQLALRGELMRDEAEVRRLDEVLTMSARMYAATGDTKWRERYEMSETVLDDVLDAARRRSVLLLGVDLVRATDLANRSLIDLENRSAAFASAGQYDAATRILESESYDHWKQAFADGLDALRRRAQHFPGRANAARTKALTLRGFCGVATVLLVFVVLRVTRRNDPRASAASVSEANARGWPWRAIVWSGVTLVGCLGLTWIAVREKQIALDVERSARFDRRADQAIAEINRRALLPEYGMDGLRSACAVRGSAKGVGLQAYVESLRGREESAAMLSVGVLRRVPAGDAVMGTGTGPDPATTGPAPGIRGDASESYVVECRETFGTGLLDSEADFERDPTHLSAITRAVRTGCTTVSEPFTYGDGLGAVTAVRYFVPIYAGGVVLSEQSARENALTAVIFATIETDALFAGIEDATDGEVSVDIYDGRRLCRESLLADTGTRGETDAAQEADAEYRRRSDFRLHHMSTHGREWTLAISGLEALQGRHTRAALIEESLGGAVFSILLAAFVFVQATAQARALSIARRMTGELAAAKDAAERSLRESEMLRSAVDGVALVSVTDAGGAITDVNDMFCRTCGYAPEELIGANHRLLSSGYHPASFWKEMWQSLADGGTWCGEICNRAKDGSIYWIDSIVAPFRSSDGGVQKYVSISNDITERKRAEQQLRAAAMTDKLTDMPNRAMFTERLGRAVERSRVDAAYHYAVLFLDFDRFKLINDSLGHEAGDQLLVQIGERLKSVLRPGDTIGSAADEGLAARLGGDEFVVLLDQLVTPEDGERVAERLLRVLSEPYVLDGHTVESTASIGIVTSRTPTSGPDEALRNADVAMYEAKAAGKARYSVFDSSMLERVRERHIIELRLRQAAKSGGIFAAFQPIVKLESGRVVSFEALMRWKDDELGFVSPARFISVAEETGLIVPLGWRVLQEACAVLSRLRSLPGGADLSMNVNVSRRQLAEPEFAHNLARLLDTMPFPPAALRIEITESLVIAAPHAIDKSIRQIKEAGVKLHMDDFGTGLSSLSLLRRLPLDGIKIDRSFLDAAEEGRESIAILRAIVDLGRNLNMSVTAEGVETREQLATVLALECDSVQGFLFGKPGSAADAAGILTTDFRCISESVALAAETAG